MAQAELAQSTSCVWFWEPSLGRRPGWAQEQVWRGPGEALEAGWSSGRSGSRHGQPRVEDDATWAPRERGMGLDRPPPRLWPISTRAHPQLGPGRGGWGFPDGSAAPGRRSRSVPRPQAPPDPSNRDGLQATVGRRGLREGAGRWHCQGLSGGPKAGRSEPEGPGEGGMGLRSLS